MITLYQSIEWKYPLKVYIKNREVNHLYNKLSLEKSYSFTYIVESVKRYRQNRI